MVSISRKLFLSIIVVVIVTMAGVSYSLFSATHFNDNLFTFGQSGASRNLEKLSNKSMPNGSEQIMSISQSQSSSTGMSSLCPSGNWSVVYSEYEYGSEDGNANLGQQYLNNTQFLSFLSQYLNMSDPSVSSMVGQLLADNQSVQLQQELQSQDSNC